MIPVLRFLAVLSVLSCSLFEYFDCRNLGVWFFVFLFISNGLYVFKMCGTSARLSFEMSNGKTELRRHLFVTKVNDLTVTCRCVTDQIQNSCEYCRRTFVSFF